MPLQTDDKCPTMGVNDKCLMYTQDGGAGGTI